MSQPFQTSGVSPVSRLSRLESAIRKEEHHIEASRAVGKPERLEVRAFEVGVRTLAVHHLHRERAAVAEREGRVRGRVRVERLRPGRVEVDRVHQDRDGPAVVARRQDRGYLAVRLLVDPGVHVGGRAGHVADLAAVEVLVDRHELRLYRALPQPERVGNVERHRRVRTDEARLERGVIAVQRIGGGRLEAQRLRHARRRIAPRAVIGDIERDCQAGRRHEHVVAGRGRLAERRQRVEGKGIVGRDGAAGYGDVAVQRVRDGRRQALRHLLRRRAGPAAAA